MIFNVVGGGKLPTPEEIGAVSMKLLWENASPASEFGAQTIALDWSGYDFILVTTTSSAAAVGSGNYQPTVFIPARVGESGAISSVGIDGNASSGYSVWGHTRTAWIRSNGIEFGNGHQYGLTTAGTNIYANWADRAVPTAIYGIKGVK